MMARYFVKAPVSGWREVDQERFERYIAFLRQRSTPTIPIEELIKLKTRIEA